MSIYDKSSLVLIPSGTKTGKVYSQKPVSGDGDFTFTRSSAATRVNADGNIEKETQNLLLQSNSFDTGWSFANANVTGGQAGYDGSNDAWLLTKTAGFGRVQRGVSVSGVHTASVYVKAGSLNWCRFLMLPVVSGTDPQVYINLSDGSLGSEYNNITATSTSVGNGWYRLTLTFQQAITEFRIYPADANNNVSGTGSIYIQDAQLEQGLVARDYIETTTTAVEGGITDNVPRLDYTDSSCPALLLEPQRTNLITQSEYFNGADWINVNVTATENAATSPEGVQNATQLDFTGTSFKRFEQNTSNAQTACTTSIFMKYIDHAIVMARMDSTSGSSYAWFNIQTGEVLKVDGANGSVPDPIASVDDYGNGWYRLNTTQTAMAGSQEIFWYFVPDTDTSTGSWTGSGSAYAYGAQFEQGSYATSYIPTYGSSVSRVKDDCTLSDVSNVIADSKGSFYIEGNLSTMDTSGVIALTAGANTQDLFYIFITTAGVLLCEWWDGGTSQARLQTPAGSISVGDSFKIAVAYQDNDFVAYWNGTQIGTDSSGIAPTPTLLRIGKYNVDNYTGGAYTNAMVFPTRLSNQELQDLTTL